MKVGNGALEGGENPSDTMRRYPILLILFVVGQFVLGWWFFRMNHRETAEEEYARLAHMQDLAVEMHADDLYQRLHLLTVLRDIDIYHYLDSTALRVQTMGLLVDHLREDLYPTSGFNEDDRARSLRLLDELDTLSRSLLRHRATYNRYKIEETERKHEIVLKQAKQDLEAINQEWPPELQRSTTLVVLYRYLNKVLPKVDEIFGRSFGCFWGPVFHPVLAGDPTSFAGGDSLLVQFDVVEYPVDRVNGFHALVNGRQTALSPGGRIEYRTARTQVPDSVQVKLYYKNPLTGESLREGEIKVGL